jgi:transcriptional regulator of acetoin/glycerol metabolism
MYQTAKNAKRHSEMVNGEITGNAPAYSAVTASWRRSMLHYGLTPNQQNTARQLSGSELREVKQGLDLLMHVASPIMKQLFQSVGRSGCCVVLTDMNGVILHRLINVADDTSFDEWGLRAGAIWSEARQGTNGIGTCAVEERPVLIHKDQHFRYKNIGMTCMGAPIFDTHGKIMAVLDVSSARNDLDRDFAQVIASFVTDIASRIEAEFFRASFAGAQIVVADGYSPGGTPLLASDRDDLVIGANRAARRMLSLQGETFSTPIPRSDLQSTRPEVTGLLAAERAEVRKAIARTKGNMSAAAKDLEVSRATLYRLLKKHGLGGGE